MKRLLCLIFGHKLTTKLFYGTIIKYCLRCKKILSQKSNEVYKDIKNKKISQYKIKFYNKGGEKQ